MKNLPYDAIPEILKLKDDHNKSVSKEVNNYLDGVKENLSQWHSWYEFNYSKYRVKKILD